MRPHRTPPSRTFPASAPARRSGASGLPLGFTLIEVLIAMAVFLLIMLTALQVYTRSNEGYKRGKNQADLAQSVRVGFDQMVMDIRLAGFEFDLDGDKTKYPNQPDEPVELMGERAIIVRGNMDFINEDQLRGREPGLELRTVDSDECCPVVTTGNDEIVGYYLGKPQGETQPVGTLQAFFDTSGTLDTDDTLGRDASISSAGAITGEETIQVTGVQLTNVNTASDTPPYVLYRFFFDETGAIVKQPLVDNIRSLRYRYYDKDGTELTPNGGADGTSNADRDLRWRIRRIKVELIGMEPERDLRWRDYADPNTLSDRHRKFKLEADIVPPNIGRRGQIDRSVTIPSPVTNVAVCVGQCNMVRVTWDPPPPEDRVADYIVSLFTDPPPHADNARVAAFVTSAEIDTTSNPFKEFAVFNSENDPDLVIPQPSGPGPTLWAQVIARDQGGGESEPAESNSNAAPALRSGQVNDRARPEPPTDGRATGYDETDPSWPDAEPDNTGGLPVVTDSSATDHYPEANQVSLRFTPPEYALNHDAGAGSAPYDWTTKDLGGNVRAAMDCHREEISPEDGTQDLRTPIEELSGVPTPERFNVYVFRVSGSDGWNWDGDWDLGTNPITDPRNFVPGPSNLHDFTWLNVSEGDTVTYIDTSESDFDERELPDTPYAHRFRSTTRHLRVANRPVPAALAPGEVYYYRFRVVDLCWKDTGPGLADGRHDSFEGAGALPVTAWMRRSDFGTDLDYRRESCRISPFYPPLLNEGNGVDQRDEPDQGTHDSDGLAGDTIDTYALPGYAIPRLVDGTYLRPEKATDLYVDKTDQDGTAVIDPGDSDGDTVPNEPGFRLRFNSSKRNETTDPAARQFVGYTRYRLVRRAPANDPPSTSDLDFSLSSGNVETILDFRTDGGWTSGGPPTRLPLWRYTLDRSQEASPRIYGRNAETPSGGGPYVYRLFTAQCLSSGGLSTDLDDGIDTATDEWSAGSPPVVFPCGFYDQVDDVDVLPPESRVNQPVIVDVTMTMPDGSPNPNCDGWNAARLLAYDRETGDYLGSSDWSSSTPSSCSITFSSSLVSQARRGYTGMAQYVVELSDAASDQGVAEGGFARGCKVRSALLYEGDESTGGGCSVQCVDANNRGRCPLNNFMADPVTTSLLPDGNGDPARIARATWTQTCPNCALPISEIQASVNAGDDRDCTPSSPLPNLVGARITHADGREDVLPLVAPFFTESESEGGCRREYDWIDLDDVLIDVSETFHLDLVFDGPMNDTEFVTLTLAFGSPLPNTAGGDDPTCVATPPSIPID
jgi:prepilin-type N-terminal cleavage/methylation domain-containing protein